MTQLADIHCHILPYVDDGAEHMEETELLLAAQARQGVRLVCATPHLRHNMFESSDEAVFRQLDRVKDFLASSDLPIRLYLGREYYCDSFFLNRMEEKPLITMGDGNTVLMEFSSRYSVDEIGKYIQRVKAEGYQPLVAHVERYPAMRGNPANAETLISLGAKLQINAGSVLGREGLHQKRFVWKLMKQGLVYVIASDSHDPEFRKPEMDACAAKVERKMGEAYANQVFWVNPLTILSQKD